MQLKAFRQRGDKVEVSHYRVNVNKFRSRLNVYCITEKLHVKVKFDGWPEVSFWQTNPHCNFIYSVNLIGQTCELYDQEWL